MYFNKAQKSEGVYCKHYLKGHEKQAEGSVSVVFYQFKLLHLIRDVTSHYIAACCLHVWYDLCLQAL